MTFPGRHFLHDVILQAVLWYLRYKPGYAFRNPGKTPLQCRLVNRVVSVRVIIFALLFLAGVAVAGYSERTVNSPTWPLPVMETGKDRFAETNIASPLDGLANEHIQQKIELLTRLIDQTHISSGAMLAKTSKVHNVKSLPDFETRQTRYASSGGGTSPGKHIISLPGGGDSATSTDQYSSDRKQAPPEEWGGKGQNGPPRRNNRPGRDKQPGEGNNDQPDKNSTSTAPSPDATPKPLTITFIGQTNAKQSSLANCLLGIKQFIAKPVTTWFYEKDDFSLQDIVIRALPGYGKWPLTPARFLDKFPIKPSELVVLVMGKEMDKTDKTVLAGLLANGHPARHILLVRIEFDKSLSAALVQQGISKDKIKSKNEIKRLQETLINRQKEHLNELSKFLKKPTAAQHETLEQAQQTLLTRFQKDELERTGQTPLIFLSAQDINTFREEHDKALIQAINHRLTERQQQVFMEQLIRIRPQNIGGMNQFIEKVFRDELNREPAATGVFTRICNALNGFFGLPFSGTCKQWQQTFRDVFERDFEQAVADAKKEPRHQMLLLEHLHRQFSAFYKGYIFGQPWYDFIRYEITREPDAPGQTVLHQWAREGREGWIWLRLQLARGKRADGSSDSGATALMLAAQNGYTETVGALLGRGAEVNLGCTDNGTTALMFAALNGYTETVLTLLDQGAEVNQGCTDDGTTALMLAAKNGHIKTVLALLDRGAEVNQGTTYSGTTALMVAALNGHTEIVLALLDRGAVVNLGTAYSGTTALMFAARDGHTKTVLALLDRGAVVNQGTIYSGTTALMLAAKNGHTETVLALLGQGAEANQACTDDGTTALRLATQNGHTETVLTLLDRGAAVNQGRTDNGTTGLMIAAQNGLTKTVLALLDRGAKVNQGRADDGATALMAAAENGHTETVLALLDRGAEINQGTQGWLYSGTTALMLAVKKGHTETVLALLDRGAVFNQGDTYGSTALVSAAQNGRTETVLALLDRGAVVNQADKYGTTALMRAAQNGRTETVLTLLDRGAAVNQDTTHSGTTALILAATDGHTETVRVLLDRGAVVNRGTTFSGTTALMLAAKNGHTETVLALLERGAEANQGCTDDGTTALILAAQNGHTETVLALLDRGAAVNQGRTVNGATALMLAAQNGHTETVLALLVRGAEVNKSYTDNGTTALMLAALHSHTETVLALLNRGAVVNQGDKYGTTALMLAALNGHTETVLALLDRDAVVNLGSPYSGATALMSAAKNGHTGTVLALLDRGAEVNQGYTDSGTTALMIAALQGHAETVGALLDRGAEVNQGYTDHGTTALMLADLQRDTETAAQLMRFGAQFCNIGRARWGDLLKVAAIHGLTEPARQLLERGAQPNSRDTEGFTPLYYANRHGHTETAKLLLDRGALVEGRNTLAGLDLNLTITLVGQPNVGKSSLANCLIGFNHFVTGPVRTTEDEGDFLFHGLRIRSLPGYGDRDALPADSFLERYPIDNSELVLMVMGDGLDGIDRIVLDGLVQKGHPPERILFVRNKFQDALQGECERNGVSPGSPEAAEMEQRLKGALQTAHWKKLETYENRLESRGQTLAIPSVEDDHDLLFTTAEHVAFFQEEDALVRKIRSRLTALNQRRGFDLFVCLRPGKHQALLRNLEHGFWHSLSSSSPPCFQEVNNQLNSMTGLAAEIDDDWLDGFNKQYKCDYEQSVLALWKKLNRVRHDFHKVIEQQPVNTSGDYVVIPEEPLSEEARPDAPQAETFRNFYQLLWTEASEPLPAAQVWRRLTPAKRHNALELFKTLDTEIAHWARKFSVFYTVEKLGKHWYQKLGMSSNTDHPDPEVFRNWPDHALHLAVTGPTDNPDAARVLITEFGANPHNRNPFKGDSLEPVHLAAANGHNHVLDMLLSEFKISPNTESEQGYSPLHIAARTGRTDMVRMLMARSDINILARNSCTPLHLAAAEGHTKLARVLITDFGANVWAKDQNGDMPLHTAARAGHTDFARMLIDDFQVSSHVTNHHLSTPLHHAVLNGHMECAKMLLTKEAKASTADRQKDNALHKAAIGGHTDIARMLIAEHGLKPNARNKDDNTPLHFAVQGGHLECVRMLICESNADPYTRNNKGETPIGQALRKGGYGDITNCLRVPSSRAANINDIMQVFERSLGNRQAFNPAR